MDSQLATKPPSTRNVKRLSPPHQLSQRRMFEEDGSNWDCCLVSSPSTCARKKKKNSMFRKRFSDDQIRLLETIFESESRLEPRKKLQVATQLGLQPRQVAIWFQNKRARWKSKQLEHEFNLLRSNYDALLSRFQALNKEKQALASQLQKLNDVIGRRRREEDNSGEPKSENTEREEKPSLSIEGSESEDGVLSDLVRAEYGGLQKEEEKEEDEAKPLRIGDGPSTISQESWSSLDSDALIFPLSNSNEWWNFWS